MSDRIMKLKGLIEATQDFHAGSLDIETDMGHWCLTVADDGALYLRCRETKGEARSCFAELAICPRADNAIRIEMR